MVEFTRVSKVAKTSLKIKDFRKISEFNAISPPSIFVGSKLAYPKVNVGILSPIREVKDAGIYDDYKFWAKNNFSIANVMRLRNNLLNSRFQSNVTDSRIQNKFLDIAKEIALSSKPVDLELDLKNRPNLVSSKDKIIAPQGFKGDLKNAKIISNVKINSYVDKVTNDEVSANEGIEFLYSKGIDEYSLSKILSVGVLGTKAKKKMVPTRWSITATDDILSKKLLEKIKEFPSINNYELLFGEFLGNQYLILLFPDIFNFELFEFYYPGSSWNPGTDFKASHDYESFLGRSNYATNCAGGYYATRLPITEYLNSIKKQAGVLVIRLETPSYWAGLGVWVVRESVRKAINSGAVKFSLKKEFMEVVEKIGKTRFDFDISLIYEKSWYLNNSSKQKRLEKWFQ